MSEPSISEILDEPKKLRAEVSRLRLLVKQLTERLDAQDEATERQLWEDRERRERGIDG